LRDDLPDFGFTLAQVAEPYLFASKQIVRWPDDSISINQYDRVTWWYFKPLRRRSLAGMAHLLRQLATQPTGMIVIGAPVLGLDQNRSHLRRWSHSDASTNTLMEVERGWLPIDCDSVPVPEPLGLPERLPEAAVWIRDHLLPVEFGDVACLATPTAQTGLHGPGIARLRLFFLLSQCWPLSVLQRWARGAQLSALPVDPAVFQPGQPIYTARPRFNGMDDPVPAHLHVVEIPGSYGGYVSLVAHRFDERLEVAACTPSSNGACAPSSNGAGVGDDWKAYLDNTVGGELSYFQPLTSGLGRAALSSATEDEIISFVTHLVADRADRDRLAHYDANWVRSTLRRFRAADRRAVANIERMRAQLFHTEGNRP
jgi:hypothetical protein